MKLKLSAVTFLAASLLAVLPLGAAPQSPFPDTPAAHQFAAWLEAFNSGDRAKLLEFLQKNHPSHAGDIDGELGFRWMTGGFEFKKVEESTPTRFAGIVKERDSDTFARFVVEVESQAPHRITKSDLEQIATPPEFAVPRLSQDAALSALRAELDKRALELRTLQDYVKLYGQRGVEFEPGSKWAYSNYGFLLLGVLIEKVSGQSYYDYVAEHVYKPAGMTLTASLAEDEAVPGRSVGYTHRRPGGPGDGAPEAWRPNTDTLPYRGTSAGGGYSTVEDLFRFASAIENHKLLDAQHTELLTTGKVDTPRGGKYGSGFGDDTIDGVRCFGHGGGAPGMNGDLKICPQAGYVIAVLANLDPPAAQRVSDFGLNRLPEK